MPNELLAHAFEKLRLAIEGDPLFAQLLVEPRAEEVVKLHARDSLIEGLWRSSIDEAVSQWVANGHRPAWPENDETDWAVWRLYFLRFVHAGCFCKAGVEPESSNLQRTEEELLRWLLIDLWRQSGIDELKAALKESEEIAKLEEGLRKKKANNKWI